MFTFPLRRLAGLLPVVAALVVTPAASAASSPPNWKPFAADSVWNLPLRADAPVSSSSAAQVTWLRGQITAHSTWINSYQCAMPIYWAELDTPRVAVTLAASSYQERAMLRAWSSVPIPPEAKPANCTDKNFTVMQTQPDGTVTAWEFWSATKAADGSWSAKWGGVTQDVLSDRGIASTLSWRDPLAPLGQQNSAAHWNVTGSSVAMAAGVITLDDLARGSIDHAVSMAATDAAKGQWYWPAQRSDGASTDPNALREGAHLRIDPSLDLDTITMTPLVRMIARASQRYGIIIRDRTLAANVFYVEEPHTGQTNPVRTLLDGKYPDTALLAFPWSRLQLLDAPTCSTISNCTVTPKAVINTNTPQPKVGEPIELDTTNSVLEHPRQLVEWDLDGNSTYETPTGRQVKTTYTPTTPGPNTINVRITTRNGTTTTGTAEVNAAGNEAPPSAPASETPSSPSTPTESNPDVPSNQPPSSAAPSPAATQPTVAATTPSRSNATRRTKAAKKRCASRARARSQKRSRDATRRRVTRPASARSSRLRRSKTRKGGRCSRARKVSHRPRGARRATGKKP